MIALLTGTIASVSLHGDVVIDVSGVGYKVAMPEKETALLTSGGLHTFHISTHVRDDAITLYGFHDATTRDLFDQITSVSGIGPKLGLAMISSLGAEGIVTALNNNDVDMLCHVPGIGKKTAQRMIIELSHVKGITDLFIPTQGSATLADVTQALEELGYRREEIAQATRDIDPTLSADVMIKECLRFLSAGVR